MTFRENRNTEGKKINSTYYLHPMQREMHARAHFSRTYAINSYGTQTSISACAFVSMCLCLVCVCAQYIYSRGTRNADLQCVAAARRRRRRRCRQQQRGNSNANDLHYSLEFYAVIFSMFSAYGVMASKINTTKQQRTCDSRKLLLIRIHVGCVTSACGL